ncbi:MAG: hypothetical protein ACC656_14010 [Candidatus Heimdallarchaeota archaeon]
MDNAKEYPEAWKIFVDCSRKWPKQDSEGVNRWIYGIPNPEIKNQYIYSHCPAVLFKEFKDIFYKSPQEKIKEFRDFLSWLEFQEGKMSYENYKSRTSKRI